MFYYKEELINQIVPDKPDPAAAKVLQETLGGRFGEM
jgi:Mn-containing catalase